MENNVNILNLTEEQFKTSGFTVEIWPNCIDLEGQEKSFCTQTNFFGDTVSVNSLNGDFREYEDFMYGDDEGEGFLDRCVDVEDELSADYGVYLMFRDLYCEEHHIYDYEDE